MTYNDIVKLSKENRVKLLPCADISSYHQAASLLYVHDDYKLENLKNSTPFYSLNIDFVQSSDGNIIYDLHILPARPLKLCLFSSKIDSVKKTIVNTFTLSPECKPYLEKIKKANSKFNSNKDGFTMKSYFIIGDELEFMLTKDDYNNLNNAFEMKDYWKNIFKEEIIDISLSEKVTSFLKKK